MKRLGARRSSHTFAEVEGPKIQRSQFNLSHGYKTAFSSGYLVPFMVDLAYPGDTFNVQANLFARLATPVVPFMDNLYLDTFYFAVPIRLVWTNFKKFMGEQANPNDSTSYTIPQSTSPAGGYTVGSLHDYMGLPTAGQITGANTVTHNNLALRAYNLIWNEWFRDENMQNSVVVDVDDGTDTYSDYVLLKRGKRKDYFTGALPQPQKATAVSLPIGTKAQVWGEATSGHGSGGGLLMAQVGSNSDSAELTSWAGGTVAYANLTGAAGNNMNVITATNAAAQSYTTSGLYADLTNATAATINQFRQAIQLQGWYERDMRSGTRYTEIVQGHFGVVSPDARLQRPEYLGGTCTPIKINPVAATAFTSGSNALGQLGAIGVVGTPRHGFVKSFTEHSIVLAMVCVRAELSYQQGLNRFWTDQTRADLYWPAFAHLGEQTVYAKEIYCLGTSQDNDVFGYQERYGHLKYKQSMITGILRSTAASTVDVWHLAQKFTSQPSLGDTFIKETPPISRVIAVNTEPEFILDAWLDFKAVRPMPMYGTPATLARF